MENTTNSELSAYRIRGVLSKAITLNDKALLIEKEVGLDVLMAMISSGESDIAIANSLDINLDELTYILSRTVESRKNLLNARMFQLATASAETLGTGRFSELTEFDKNTNYAALYHLAVIDKTSKVLNAPTGDRGVSVTVTNNTQVVNNNHIPDIPDELKGFINVDYFDIDEQIERLLED